MEEERKKELAAGLVEHFLSSDEGKEIQERIMKEWKNEVLFGYSQTLTFWDDGPLGQVRR